MEAAAVRTDRSGHWLIVIAALTWGTIGVAVSLLYRMAPADPLMVGALRLLIAGPALLLLARLLAGAEFWRLRRAHLGLVALIGAAFAGYQVLYFAAIPRLGVAAAVMINICSAPIFTALLAGAFLRERIGPLVWLAMGGAVAGTALLVGGAPQAAGPALLSGAALALGAGLCYSLVALGARAIAPFYHPVTPVALAFSLGAVLLLPLALLAGRPPDFPPAGWALLAYLALVPTAGAYALYLRGMRSTPATVAAIISLLEPLGSAILAVLFLGERLSALGGLGAGLLLASIGLLFLAQGRPAA